MSCSVVTHGTKNRPGVAVALVPPAVPRAGVGAGSSAQRLIVAASYLRGALDCVCSASADTNFGISSAAKNVAASVSANRYLKAIIAVSVWVPHPAPEPAQ